MFAPAKSSGTTAGAMGPSEYDSLTETPEQKLQRKVQATRHKNSRIPVNMAHSMPSAKHIAPARTPDSTLNQRCMSFLLRRTRERHGFIQTHTFHQTHT